MRVCVCLYCKYVCVRICVLQVYMYTCTSMYIRTGLHAYISMYIRTGLHAYIRVCIHTGLSVRLHCFAPMFAICSSLVYVCVSISSLLVNMVLHLFL